MLQPRSWFLTPGCSPRWPMAQSCLSAGEPPEGRQKPPHPQRLRAVVGCREGRPSLAQGGADSGMWFTLQGPLWGQAGADYC